MSEQAEALPEVGAGVQ